MRGYEFAFGEEAVLAFARLTARQRERALTIAETLARHPSLRGDYNESGSSGRRYEVKLFGDFVVTWWTDHAAREVYVLRLERIE